MVNYETGFFIWCTKCPKRNTVSNLLSNTVPVKNPFGNSSPRSINMSAKDAIKRRKQADT